MRYITNVGMLIFIEHSIDFIFNFRLSNPNISEWMITMNISNATGIHSYYASRILNITSQIDVEPIVWQDVWDEGVEV